MYRTNDSRTSKGSPGWLTVLLVVAGLLLVPPGVEAQTRTASTHATLLIGHYSNSAVSGTLGGVLYGKEGLSGRAGGGGNLGLLFGGGSGALAVELYGLWRTSSSEAVDAASPYLGAGPSIWAGIAGNAIGWNLRAGVSTRRSGGSLRLEYVHTLFPGANGMHYPSLRVGVGLGR